MQKEPLKAAVCLGSTGAVGQKLIEELSKNPSFGTILMLVRKPSSPNTMPNNEKLVEHVIQNMHDLESEVSQSILSKLPKHEQVVGFSTIGIGHGTANLTIDQHRAVDVELNSKFAKGLKNSGKVQHLVFMSAVGSNPNSWAGGPGGAGFPRYSRVKGEAEEAVKAVGIDHVSIFRPATILGIPNTPKIVEIVMPWLNFLLPANAANARVEDLAKSMAIRGAQSTVTQEKENVRVFHHPEMMELINQTM
jgi:nucleoside-diphosphate-sugar epimerase